MTCGCGRPAQRGDKCHRCYMKAWHARRKTLPRIPCDEDWFDWEVVGRAWSGSPVNRRLTRAERVHLAGIIVNTTMGVEHQRAILGMSWEGAAKLVSDVREGRVPVPARAWDGTAL